MVIHFEDFYRVTFVGDFGTTRYALRPREGIGNQKRTSKWRKTFVKSKSESPWLRPARDPSVTSEGGQACLGLVEMKCKDPRSWREPCRRWRVVVTFCRRLNTKGANGHRIAAQGELLQRIPVTLSPGEPQGLREGGVRNSFPNRHQFYAMSRYQVVKEKKCLGDELMMCLTYRWGVVSVNGLNAVKHQTVRNRNVI